VLLYAASIQQPELKVSAGPASLISRKETQIRSVSIGKMNSKKEVGHIQYVKSF
jgi:hypothetical protein